MGRPVNGDLSGAGVKSECIDALLSNLPSLLGRRRRVLVATSGGPDSQAMLDAVARVSSVLSLEVWAAGVDHGLRAAAPAELDKAANLAHRHGVPFRVLSLAESPSGGNLLQWARVARYRALFHLRRVVGAEAVLVAHTADDQVETMLMHLTRGAGLAGWQGMLPRRGAVVRPWLQVTRSQVLQHLQQFQICFAQDPSNADPRRARTLIRQQIVPALRQLNTRAVPHMAESAAQAHAWARRIRRADERALARCAGPSDMALSLAPLGQLSSYRQKATLFRWLKQIGARPTRRSLERILKAVATADRSPICIPGGFVRICEHGLYFELGRPVRAQKAPISPWEDVPIDLSNLSPRRASKRWVCASWTLAVRMEAVSFDNSSVMAPRGMQTVAFDADRLHVGLLLRPWRSGDRMRPFGRKGRALVSDLFNQAQVPTVERLTWPVLVDGDEILWVPGVRRAGVAPLTAQTRRLLRVSGHRHGLRDGSAPPNCCSTSIHVPDCV